MDERSGPNAAAADLDQPAADSLRDRARAGGIADARRGVAAHARGGLRTRSAGNAAPSGRSIGRESILRCVGTWHAPGLAVRGVHRGHRDVDVRARASACPGRVWASREPAWIPDVTRDANFPRAAVAERAGLHAAFALPIMQGRRVQGVLEFFSRDIREPSPDLLAMMTTVCSQIGCSSSASGPATISTGSSSCRWICSASPRSTATSCGSIPPGRRVLGFSEEELRIDAVHGLRPPGRPGRHGRARCRR